LGVVEILKRNWLTELVLLGFKPLTGAVGEVDKHLESSDLDSVTWMRTSQSTADGIFGRDRRETIVARSRTLSSCNPSLNLERPA
jgi:hypothetical protein